MVATSDVSVQGGILGNVANGHWMDAISINGLSEINQQGILMTNHHLINCLCQQSLHALSTTFAVLSFMNLNKHKEAHIFCELRKNSLAQQTTQPVGKCWRRQR